MVLPPTEEFLLKINLNQLEFYSRVTRQICRIQVKDVDSPRVENIQEEPERFENCVESSTVGLCVRRMPDVDVNSHEGLFANNK